MVRTISEAEYRRLTDGDIGLCRACGDERECTEPDAEHYPCEACGESEVFGTEQLLLMGELDIGELEEPDAERLVDALCGCGWGRLSIPESSVPTHCPLCGHRFIGTDTGQEADW